MRPAVIFSSILLFLAILVLYSLGVAKSVFGGDSGDIVLSYFYAGVPHPPGYPLNTLLGWTLSRLPFGESYVVGANFVSSIYHACAVGLLFLLMFRLTKNFFVALSSSLVLAFNPLFWLYAHLAEVFQLTAVLIVASLYFLFSWWMLPESKKPKSRYLPLAFLFFGLSVFHHQTVIFLAPAYAFFALVAKKYVLGRRQIWMLFGAFLAGIIPYIFVFWAAGQKTPINWDDPSNFRSFWQLITRSDYGSFSAAPGLVGFSPMARLAQIWWYFKVVLADFTVLGFGLALLGGVFLYLKKRDWFWFFALCFFFSGPLFISYAGFPPLEPFLQGVSERFFLTSYLFLAIFTGFGLSAILEALSFLSKKYVLLRRDFFALMVGGSFLLFPMAYFFINLPKTDLSDYSIGETIAQDILASASPSGIIFLQGDTVSFNTQYYYYAERVSPDSKPILLGRLRHASYRSQVMEEFPELVYPESFRSSSALTLDEVIPEFWKLLLANYEKFPIYIVEPVPVDDDYVWVQEGMLARLYRTNDAPKGNALVAKIEDKFSRLHFSDVEVSGKYLHFFADHIKSVYVRVYVDNGQALLKESRASESQKYFNAALGLDGKNNSALFGLAASYLDLKECELAKELFLQVTSNSPDYWQAWDGLGVVFSECLEDEEGSKVYFERAKNIKEGQFEPIELK